MGRPRKLIKPIKKLYRVVRKKPAKAPPVIKDGAEMDEVAQGLLDLSKGLVDFYKANPARVLKNPSILSHAFAAQKVLLDKSRLQMEESALRLGLARMFGGFLKVGPVKPYTAEEAEEVLPKQLPVSKES